MALDDDRYFAGLVDGEGCFQIVNPVHESWFVLRLDISQRLDRGKVLEQLREIFGGLLVLDGTKQLCLTIRKKKDLLGLIRYFDRFPLIIKANEYEVWREAAILYNRYSCGPGAAKNPEWLVEAMRAACKELKRLKKYQAKALEFQIEHRGLQLDLIEPDAVGSEY